MVDNVKVYVPDNSIKKGYRSLFREMAEEVRTSKWLTWQLFKRDFKVIYQQSVLGILWILIPPLMTVGTFIFLSQAGIFNVGDISVPYPLYALLGVALWQVFATSLSSTTNSLMAAGSMISKINFPREALVFSAMGKALITFIIQMSLVVVLLAYYGIIPPWTILLFPFTLIPVLLLALGLGLILSILNGVIRDVGRTLPIITTFLMFLTPILYATPQSGFLSTLTEYNPLYYLLIVPRDLILIGETSLWDGYLISTLFSIGVFFVCWILFHLTETRIAERI